MCVLTNDCFLILRASKKNCIRIIANKTGPTEYYITVGAISSPPVGCLIEGDVRVTAEVKVTTVVAELTNYLQSEYTSGILHIH